MTRLLPAFDPVVVGARPREYLVAADHESRIFRPQAWFSPVLLVDDKAAGIWSHERGGTLRVRIELFGRLDSTKRKALEVEAELLAEFLGAPAELSVAA